MSRVIDEHRIYLADPHRLGAFRRAIQQTVKPDHIVLDLASGTGILGFMACQAGAARVYGLEVDGILGLARRLAAANGFGDRYVGIRGMSTRAVLPEPVDVIVTDQIGPFGFEADLFAVMSDAAVRFLKRGGAIIPQSVAICLAPLTSDDIRERVDFWHSQPGGLDYGAAATIAANTGYTLRVDDAQGFLANPAVVSHWSLPAHDVVDIGGSVEFEFTRPGRLDGICGWFEATLAPGVTMTNAPGAPDRIERRNVVLPVPTGIAVAAGDRLHVALHIHHRETMVTWRSQVSRSSGEVTTFTGSTFRGMLISSEDLARTAPDSQPRLSRAGEARRLILQLADGQHTVRGIEDAVAASYGDLFTSGDSVHAFVGEVLVRYAL